MSLPDEEETARLVTSAANHSARAHPPAPPAASRFGRNMLAFVTLFFLLGALVALFVSSEDSDLDVRAFDCRGDLAPSECVSPCPASCSALVQSDCSAPCSRGCSCPSARPVLATDDKCVASKLECAGAVADVRLGANSSSANRGEAAAPTTATAPTDFSACEAPWESRAATAYLSQEAISSPEHVRLATAPCPGRSGVLVHFTSVTEPKRRTCDGPAAPLYLIWYAKRGDTAHTVVPRCISCIQLGLQGSVHHFFVARLPDLAPGQEYSYEIGVEKGGPEGKRPDAHAFVAPPLPGQSGITDSGIIVGDTDYKGAQHTFAELARVLPKPSLVLHVGDSSYATNKGACYGHPLNEGANGPCGWNCTGDVCLEQTKHRVEIADLGLTLHWAALLKASALGGNEVWMTTPGNHDNDLSWFVTYRPPLNASLPGVWAEDLAYTPDLSMLGTNAKDKQLLRAVMLMKEPHFYSFDHGLVHVAAIGTEDNPFNAYEMWDGQPLSAALERRFEQHYGAQSRQFRWLQRDLAAAHANRGQVPWVLLITHRPMYHTAAHHGMCSGGGDWYACKFRALYEPLLYRYRVNVLAGGHSHHYQRSAPMFREQLDPNGTVHLVVGTGGFDLTGDDWVGSPKWVAHRQGTSYGFVRYRAENRTHLWLEHVSSSPQSAGKVLDSAWVVNSAL